MFFFFCGGGYRFFLLILTTHCTYAMCYSVSEAWNTLTVSLQRDISQSQRGVQDMIWWGSSLDALGSVEYSFIAITPRFTLTRKGNICWGSIFGSKRSLWDLFVFDWNIWYYMKEKEAFKKTTTQKYTNNERNSLTSRHNITFDGLTCR